MHAVETHLVLLPACGNPEALPLGTKLGDVFKGPTYAARVDAKGAKVFWSAQTCSQSEVNGSASAAAGQLVTGDACLTVRSAGTALAWLTEFKASSAKHIEAFAQPPRHFSTTRSPLSGERPLRPPSRPGPTSPTQAQGVQRAGEGSSASRPHLGLHPLPQQPQGPHLARLQHASVRYGAQVPSGRAGTSETPETAPHPAAQVSSCEPHQQLLFTIMGRITSTGTYNLPSRPPPPLNPTPSSPRPTGPPSSPRPAENPTSPEEHPRHAAAAAPGGPEWDALPPELVASIFREHLGGSAAAAVALSGVCRTWRAALLGDGPSLLAMRCAVNPSRPLQRPPPGHRAPGGGACAGPPQKLPAVLLQAASVGSVGACVAAAQLSGAVGRPGEAFSYWAKAARRGDPQGQARLGEAHYRGLFGLARDGEEALLWCSRAAKQLLALQEQARTPAGAMGGAQEGGEEGRRVADGGRGAGGAVRGGEKGYGRAWREVLGGTALLLGFLFLDGEATKRDAVQAVKWFKVAAANGSKDALKVLGMLFNSGQYG